MEIRMAGMEDIELLTELRMAYILDGGRQMTEEEKQKIRSGVRGYFTRNLPIGSCIAVIAEEEGKAVSTAFLSIAERPPRSADGDARVGTVYSVYTDPEYRRKGIATQVMKRLIDEARSMGIPSLDMLASEAGKPLYEKLGFVTAQHIAMRMKL